MQPERGPEPEFEGNKKERCERQADTASFTLPLVTHRAWADQHLSLSREVGAGMGVPGQGEEMLQVPSGQPGRWGCPQGGTTGGAGLGAVFVAVCRQALGAGPRPGNPHDLSAILSEGHRTHGTGARGCLEGSSLGQDLRRNRQARRG